jgi:pimeloyl-ACP methyl ester carboxylesterase
MSGRSFLLDVAGGCRRIRVFEAGDGPPLVFLHGAGGQVEESPFLAALGRRWHVFAPLLPGYGDSEGGDTLPDMLAITLHSFDVIEALGWRTPIWSATRWAAWSPPRWRQWRRTMSSGLG